MLKRSLLLWLLVVAFILSGLTAPCIAQETDSETQILAELQACMNDLQGKQDGSIVSTRGATEYVEFMKVPYNIMSGDWVTGINIECINDDELLIGYYHDSDKAYSAVKIPFRAGENLTKVVNDKILLPTKSFQSPTTIWFFSKNGSFAVSQFLMNSSGGFGFQTFFSKSK